ncbi:DUF2147 domain-containing protein [Variovorax ureilyticus]|uniref:DUF2147 domain-containing protein n=1 Tax=Variovorax ureilyticus TaxID=1836198 RepID=UPI003D66D556
MKSRFAVLAAVVLASAAMPVLAQMNPLGVWRTFDEKTGEAKAEIRIDDSGGALVGRIEKVLEKGVHHHEVCDECRDDRRGKPIVGLEIIRGGRQADGREVWEGGRILDPENGKEYRSSLTPIEGGQKLQVRGYLGPFWRTQTWNRVP